MFITDSLGGVATLLLLAALLFTKSFGYHTDESDNEKPINPTVRSNDAILRELLDKLNSVYRSDESDNDKQIQPPSMRANDAMLDELTDEAVSVYRNDESDNEKPIHPPSMRANDAMLDELLDQPRPDDRNDESDNDKTIHPQSMRANDAMLDELLDQPSPDDRNDEPDYEKPIHPNVRANDAMLDELLDEPRLKLEGHDDLVGDTNQSSMKVYQKGIFTPTWYCGFKSGKLVCVKCYLSGCRRNCESIGLISQNKFSYGNYWSWDSLPWKYMTGILGPGITKWWVVNIAYDLSNWMSRVPDSLLLRHMALPGSHDAGSAQSELFFFRTQSFSIITQLLLGIRVFDIRPTRASRIGIAREDGGIWTHHNNVKGERLSNVVTGVALFLKAYPTETAIFIMSHYENIKSPAVYGEIRSICGARGVQIVEDGTANAKTLGQSRGKLIVMDEFYADRNLGPNGDDGTTNWSVMLNHITNINKTMPYQKFQRFVVALSYRAGSLLPRELAMYYGIPGLNRWLQTTDSNKIGIVEADWWRTWDQVKSLVAMIVNKNTRRCSN